MESKSSTTQKAPIPAFIRLAEPPAFDINRHLPFIRSQLPSDQLENLEQALKIDPELFSSVSKNDLIIDCDTEESFTLETFESLLKAARGANKDFVLARVSTLDPTGLKPQVYHSHYSAHQINKILFRTQPEEGLLHRMKSRNPLNNLLIVGDVNYFVIRPKDYDDANGRYENLIARSKKIGIEGEVQVESENGNLENMSNPNPIPSINGETTATATTLTDSLLYGLLQRKKIESETGSGSPNINVAPFENAADYTSPNQSSMDLETTQQRAISRNTSTSSLKRSDSLNQLPTDGEPAILYEAQPFATDDDFLMRSDVREYFKANSVNPDDYLLFTLYRSTTEIPVSGMGFTTVPIPDGAQMAAPQARVHSWKNCWGLFYPPSPSLSTLRTGFISREAFKYIICFYIIACVLSLIFLIPMNLSYFVGFGMFVLIVFVTVFLVECNPEPNSSRWNIFSYRQRMMQQREIATTNANITSSHSVIGENSEAANSSTALNESV